MGQTQLIDASHSNKRLKENGQLDFSDPKAVQ